MSTIVAISTAPAIGGIGIIRLSGEKTFEIIEKIFIPKNKASPIMRQYLEICIHINITTNGNQGWP